LNLCFALRSEGRFFEFVEERSRNQNVIILDDETWDNTVKGEGVTCGLSQSDRTACENAPVGLGPLAMRHRESSAERAVYPWDRVQEISTQAHHAVDTPRSSTHVHVVSPSEKQSTASQGMSWGSGRSQCIKSHILGLSARGTGGNPRRTVYLVGPTVCCVQE